MDVPSKAVMAVVTTYSFQRGSMLARLHHSSFTQDARHRSVASKWERT